MTERIADKMSVCATRTDNSTIESASFIDMQVQRD